MSEYKNLLIVLACYGVIGVLWLLAGVWDRYLKQLDQRDRDANDKRPLRPS